MSVETSLKILRTALADRGITIDEGTLCPLLRRLESQGLLTSTWRQEDKQKKRFYLFSHEGSHVLIQLMKEWRALDNGLRAILREEYGIGHTLLTSS